MRRTRWKRPFIAVAVLTGVVLGLYLGRSILLPPVAGFLDVSGPPPQVDYVMVLGGGSDSRPFVAAALVNTKRAAAVLVPTVAGPVETAEDLRVPDHEVIQSVLRARGVPAQAIVLLPEPCSSTADEARSLAAFLQSHPDRTVAVVTHTFHTRRARAIFRKALPGQEQQLHFVAVPTDGFDETNWWQSEQGFQCYANEYSKLLLSWLRS